MLVEALLQKEEKMTGRRQSEEKIICALKRLQSGTKGMEACWELGVSEGDGRMADPLAARILQKVGQVSKIGS